MQAFFDVCFSILHFFFCLSIFYFLLFHTPPQIIIRWKSTTTHPSTTRVKSRAAARSRVAAHVARPPQHQPRLLTMSPRICCAGDQRQSLRQEEMEEERTLRSCRRGRRREEVQSLVCVCAGFSFQLFLFQYFHCLSLPSPPLFLHPPFSFSLNPYFISKIHPSPQTTSSRCPGLKT